MIWTRLHETCISVIRVETQNALQYPIPPDRILGVMSDLHQSHPEIINRLKRAEGHLRRIIGMIEEERRCLDLAQQLHAVEKAICQAKKQLIHDHIDHCLERSVNGGTAPASARASIEEFRAITKYL